MKVYLINLDKAVNRLASADAQLKKLGVEYERVLAVHGAGLPEEEKRKCVNRFRTWCFRGHKMRDGEIGCTLSHQKAYRQIVERNIDCACVLEDDVVLDDRFLEMLKRVEEWFKGRALDELVLLSNHNEPTGFGSRQSGHQTPNYNINNFKVKRIKRDMYAEGYVIGREAAKNLLRKNYPLIAVADDFKRFVKIGAVKLYHAFPTVCWQNKVDFESSTSDGSDKASERGNIFGMIMHKLVRAMGKSIDMVLMVITRK